MDDDLYSHKQKEKFAEYEALCLRCGKCCGVHDQDCCVNLAKDEQGKYYCRVYDNRLGLQVTVSGKYFLCIPIRDMFKSEPPYPGCAYGK